MFGDIIDGEMSLNDTGMIVGECWAEIPHHFTGAELDEWVMMPNHVHGIVSIDVGARHAVPLQDVPLPEQFGKPVPGFLPTIVRSFKSATTNRINKMRGTPGWMVWQRNYYEHIIRNDDGLNCIREYIANNPRQWEMDRENPNIPRRDDRPVAPTMPEWA